LLPEIALSLGLHPDVIVTTGAMDQVAMAVGAGNIQPGLITETTGTCLAVGVTNTTFPPAWSPVPVYSHYTKGLFFRINIMQTAGIVLKWFRDEFCLDLLSDRVSAFDLMSALAAQAPPLSKGVMVFPHFQGMNTNPDARGVITGLSLESGRDCLIRAILESVGYMLKESCEWLGVSASQICSLGGGSKSEVWNQIKADICNCDIRVLDVQEAALTGAAILGALAIGHFQDIRDGLGKIKSGKRYSPTQNTTLYRNGYEKYQEVCAWQS
jgi:xylulokinase